MGGLGGHAFGSWKTTFEQKMWLRDFLPGDLEQNGLYARILTYGYRSKLESSLSSASIYDYAQTFLEVLKTARAGSQVLGHRIVIGEIFPR
jgi:hypothetical protein